MPARPEHGQKPLDGHRSINPFSESCFKTIKYQPDYPGRFRDVADARRWFVEFFDWYANRHRHSGLALFTPADVFFGRVAELAGQRQRALDAAYAVHADRFVRGRPIVRLPPDKVAINPIVPGAATQTVQDALQANDRTTLPHAAATPMITLPGVAYARHTAADCS